MRVAIVSTYPPRACGIGTFSRDLYGALQEISHAADLPPVEPAVVDASIDVDVVAIVRDSAGSQAGEVVSVIRQDTRGDYVGAAAVLTSRGTDVVLIEHEYGIFGGVSGSYVLSLVGELDIPVVVTLHTVLSTPSPSQAETLQQLCRRATLVTVFTETARRMIVDAGMTDADRVRVVPHGVPTALLPHPTRDGKPARDSEARPALERLDGRTVLSTFGLISPGKGIELAIRSLPAVVASHPEVLYLVAGQTHPEVVKREGEKYRLSLERLVRDLGLTDHVHFLDRFLSVSELADLLSATDLYLTPYRSREQIVSGALTFAVVAGCPVVSTPYLYAEDLLSSGAGVLTPSADDPDAFGAAILSLLDDRAALAAAAAEARRVGAGLSWPAVGQQTRRVLAEAVRLDSGRRVKVRPDHRKTVELAASSPGVRPAHLLTLVDDVGIIQHADGVVPNRSSGYCVDDVARLVIVAMSLESSRLVESPGGDDPFGRIVTRGLSFLRHAYDPVTNRMHNFMGYDRRWLDEPTSGDHVGRTAWALGEVIAAHPPRAVAAPSRLLLDDLVASLDEDKSPRTIAFALLGLTRPPVGLLAPRVEALIAKLAGRMIQHYRDVRTDAWRWFEDGLYYDNARLPQALIAAGQRLGDREMVDVGLESLDWYAKQCAVDQSVIRLVGNAWRVRSTEVSPTAMDGDEQPVDGAALVEACIEALAATGRIEYGQQALRVFEWFLGRNRLGVPVYDFATGGCRDGLGATALNDNQGAESTLSFLLAVLALDRAGLTATLPG